MHTSTINTKPRLSLLNKNVKKYEKHLEVNLSVNGENVPATFLRFTEYSLNVVSFIIKGNEKGSKSYTFKYDFKTGTIVCTNTEGEVAVSDLLSKRHLCYILFYAREFALMETEMSPLTQLIHKTYPVPVFLTSLTSIRNVHLMQNKRMKIDHVLQCNESGIVVDGLLAFTDYEDFQLPILARCKYTFSGKNFTWTFVLNGKKTVITKQDSQEYNSPLFMPRSILNVASRLRMQELYEEKTYTSCLLYNVSQKIAKIWNEKELLLCTKKPGRMGIPNFFHTQFICLSLVTDKEISFSVCESNTPETCLTYDRQQESFTANFYDADGRKKEQSLTFPNDKEKNIFQKVLNIIEKNIKIIE